MKSSWVHFLFSALCCAPAFGAERIELWPAGKTPSPQADQGYAPYMTWFEPSVRTSDAILVAVSGGCYECCDDTCFEVAPIRDYFLSKGVTVVTMRYRTPRPKGLQKHLSAWQDAQRTIRLVRREAQKRGLDQERIGFTGCSAGGHLTLLVATSSQTRSYEPVDKADSLPCHVNWAVPVYPAYGLRANAEDAEVKACDDLSVGLVPEFAFDAKTPPMCLIHGDADPWSPMTSVRVYHRLRTMGVPAELHVMALEDHCFMDGAIVGTPAGNWKDRVWEWTQKLHFTTIHPISLDWGCPLPGDLSVRSDSVVGEWQVGWRGWVSSARSGCVWLCGDYETFTLDLECLVEKSGERCAFVLTPDRKGVGRKMLRVEVPADRPGEWRRMTLWYRRSRVDIAVDGVRRKDIVRGLPPKSCGLGKVSVGIVHESSLGVFSIRNVRLAQE